MKTLFKLLALMIMTCSLAFAKEQLMKVDTTPQSRVFEPSTHACAEVQIAAAIPHIKITQSPQAAVVVRTTGATSIKNTVHCEAIVHRARSKVAPVNMDMSIALAPQPTGPLGPDCPTGAFVAETTTGPLGPDNPGDGQVATKVRQEGMTKAKLA